MNARMSYRLDVGPASDGSVSSLLPVLRSLHAVAHRNDAFTFDLVARDGHVAVYVTCPSSRASHLVWQLHAHHHGLTVTATTDPFSDLGLHTSATMTVDKPEMACIQFDHKDVDPLVGLVAELAQTSAGGTSAVRITFRAVAEREVKRRLGYVGRVVWRRHTKVVEGALLSAWFRHLRRRLVPLVRLRHVLGWFVGSATIADQANPIEAMVAAKMASPCFATAISIHRSWQHGVAAIRDIAATFAAFDAADGNRLRLGSIRRRSRKTAPDVGHGFLLGVPELGALMHIPMLQPEAMAAVASRTLPPPVDLPHYTSTTSVTLGFSNHRGHRHTVHLSHEDRGRHVYILGKTGMGKTTLIESMIAADLASWRGLALIDPHGDLAEAVVGNLPKSRINHTLIFDPSDQQWPIGFNLLDAVAADRRPLVASGLVGIFKKLFSDSWGPRLEHTLRSSMLALLDYPGATLLSVPLMLTNDMFRARVVERISDPVVRLFWQAEFGRLNPTQRTETVSPILNKVGQFLSSPLLRNILGQPQSAFSLRRAMDQGKTVIVNLSKGRIGEDASSLLGAMLVTRFQLDAMSRADQGESLRRPFTLYVDEFQNFATESFATILSEARKYKLDLVMANQYVAQMPDAMRDAVFGNVGTLIAFQVGAQDAPFLKEALMGQVAESDLVNTPRYSAYVRLSSGGMPMRAFSADMLPPVPRNREAMALRYAKVLQVCRTKYAHPRAFVEARIGRLLQAARQHDVLGKRREPDRRRSRA